MKLTTADIALPNGKRDHIAFDATLKGFGLRIRRLSGGRIARSWIIQYRQHGHTRRMIIADAEKVTAAPARERARKLLAAVELGGDPQGEKCDRRAKDTNSLRSVISDFIAQKTKVKPSTLRMLRGYLEGPAQGPYLKPLHGMPIDRVTRKDIAARLLAVAKATGEPTAIALRAKLSGLFGWAMEMGLCEVNPVIGSYRPPQQKTRERVLKDAELRSIWRALGDDDYGRVIKLLILTGCRREEIAGMAWCEFDQGTWTLPAARSKNGRPHALPVTDLMQEIVDAVPHRAGNDLLFGYRGKRGFGDWSKCKRALDDKLDLPKWVIHDLRRSVATGMGNNLGIQPHVVEEILNHQSGHKRGVAGIYNRSPYEREVRAGMALWCDHIRALIEGGERKVLAFERAAVAATP
jgi:integrase